MLSHDTPAIVADGLQKRYPGDVTALDGLGSVAAVAMQARAYMADERDDCRYSLHIRLVMISINRRRRDLRAR